MARIITVTNQKGGVGKTVTVSSLGSALTSQGYKVLLINLDPQRNLDMVAGPDIAIKRNDADSKSILSVLNGECTMEEAIVHTNIGDLIRASSNLSKWTGRSLISLQEYKSLGDDPNALLALLKQRAEDGWGSDDIKLLSKKIESVQDNYDYILIDTNPSLQVLTASGIYAASYVLIPAFTEAASRDAITELWDTIRGIQFYNPDRNIQIAGILITKWVNRSINARLYVPVYEKLAKKMGTILFNQRIRSSVSVNEYMANHEDLLRYDPKGNTAQDYLAFTDELKERIDILEGVKHG